MVRWFGIALAGILFVGIGSPPIGAQTASVRVLSRAERDLLHRYAYESHDARDAELSVRSPAVTRNRREFESAQNRLRSAEGALAAARQTEQQNQREIHRLERQVDRYREEASTIAERSTAGLARLSDSFNRRLRELVAAGESLLQTQAGRRAVELAARGDPGDRAEATEIVLQELESQNEAAAQVERLRRAGRYRTAATFLLSVRGSGRATNAEITRQLEFAVADDPSHHWDWVELARLYRDANNVQKAVAAGERALATAESDRDRGVALVEQGDNLRIQAWFDDAVLRRFEQDAGNILRMLVVAMRSNPDEQTLMATVRTVADQMQQLLDVVESLRDTQPVRAQYRDALSIFTRLSESQPDSPLLKADVAVGQGRILDLDIQHQLTAVIQRFREPMRAMAGILSTARSMQEAQAAFMAAGFVQPPAFDPTSLQNRPSELVERWRSIVQMEPTPTNNESLAVALKRAGYVHELSRDLDAARERYAESLAIMERLAAEHPASERIRGGHASSLMSMAKLELVQNRYQDVQAHALAALRTFEAMAAADPSSVSPQEGVAGALELLAKSGAPGYTWGRVVSHFDAMRTRSMITPQQEGRVALARAFARAEAVE